MPKYRDYAAFTRTVEVPLANGDLLHLDYFPARYTADLRQGAVEGAIESKQPASGSRKAAAPRQPMSDSEFIVAVASGWDWENEDGEAVPITVEFLDHSVQLADRAAMVRAILENIYPTVNPTTNNNSSSV